MITLNVYFGSVNAPYISTSELLSSIKDKYPTLYLEFLKDEGVLEATTVRIIDKEYVFYPSDIEKIALRFGIEIELKQVVL
ncbi:MULTISPECIES: hypothetical protein [unclassified Vibrio]|uniref:hypothetical protein n=1 Tax=unclassified Vibrio TaxID=2614977 RepID=UPI00159EA6CE|nr:MULTISPECIES: hypothetical protein [unclassified Vibrio]NVN80551.1 hypothetical protein [Vibrio sp. Scap16]QLE95634.1 hypothetical protein FLM53_21935 [Vibrio sp. Scap24]